MPKKASRKTLKNKADRLFSLYIRARDEHCQRCGTTENLQCAHGFTRTYLKTRWDERNAWALCAGCHKFFTHRPLEWDAWMRDRLGPVVYSDLRGTATGMADRVDYEEVIADLEAKLKDAA